MSIISDPNGTAESLAGPHTLVGSSVLMMVTAAALTAVVAGWLLSLSLIVAIGAQNTYVLRQGLLREHVLVVVVICGVSDAVLIAAGVAGAGVAIDGRHWLLQLARFGGAA